MTAIAVYSMKGGVGKTTLAVNLAWSAATRSARRTLLWDLDGQGGASFILNTKKRGRNDARAVIEGDIDPETLIRETDTPGLDLLPADASLHGLDTVFANIDRKKRLRKLLDSLNTRYDRILLDCPPGLGPTSDQILRGAALIVVPIIPSTLSQRAFEEVRQHLDVAHKGKAALLPVFNMVDRRRLAHRQAVADNPDFTAIPMASLVEAMVDRHAAVGTYAPRSPAAQAIAELWTAVERRIALP